MIPSRHPGAITQTGLFSISINHRKGSRQSKTRCGRRESLAWLQYDGQNASASGGIVFIGAVRDAGTGYRTTCGRLSPERCTIWRRSPSVARICGHGNSVQSCLVSLPWLSMPVLPRLLATIVWFGRSVALRPAVQRLPARRARPSQGRPSRHARCEAPRLPGRAAAG